jgi:hypothetical protein
MLVHLTLYHETLASAHPWRSDVVPSPPEPPPGACVKKGRWVEWAEFLRRVFALEVLVCACGGKRRVLAVIWDDSVPRKILEHLALPAKAPKVAKAQEEPQGELWPTGPPEKRERPDWEPEDEDQRLAGSEAGA